MSASAKAASRPRARGFTIIELIVATFLLAVLTSLALPLARVTIKREKEKQLRYDLWQMRDAIDRYKDAADKGAFQIKVDSQGYPPDLDTLVKGVDVAGIRSMQDDPDSDSWGGQSVFDVNTKSDGVGLDDTKYKDW